MSTLNKRLSELERQSPQAFSGVSVIYRRIVTPKSSVSSRSSEIISASIIGVGRKIRLQDENEFLFLRRLEAEFPALADACASTSQEVLS